MINCKLEGEIVVRSVDDMKPESEATGYSFEWEGVNWEIEGTSELRDGNRWEETRRGRYACAQGPLGRAPRADHEIDGRR